LLLFVNNFNFPIVAFIGFSEQASKEEEQDEFEKRMNNRIGYC